MNKATENNDNPCPITWCKNPAGHAWQHESTIWTLPATADLEQVHIDPDTRAARLPTLSLQLEEVDPAAHTYLGPMLMIEVMIPQVAAAATYLSLTDADRLRKTLASLLGEADAVRYGHLVERAS